MGDFADYLSSPFVLRAFVALILAAVNAALSGAFASFRNSTFLISGASHAALGGAALVIVLEVNGIVAGVDPLIGAAVFAVVLALLAAHASARGQHADVDVTIGVGFALAMAVAVLLISLVPESASRVWGLLMGDLLLVSSGELMLVSALTLVVALTFFVFRREFLFVTFDMEGAKAFGIRATRYNYVLFALIGLSAAILVKSIGAILVFAMLSAPAATALRIAKSVGTAMWLAFGFALLAGILGILVSYATGFSVSALSAFFAAGAYFVVRAVQWESGPDE
ncbi:MAG TPA: metal ABC transporter permease [Firmicutes bacterium]|nr:metal ABC transporter permease [Bacillota bacterium]